MRTAHNTNDGRGALRASRNALRHTLHATTLQLDPSRRRASLHRSNPLRLMTHYRRILQDGAAPFTAQPLAAQPSTAVQPSTSYP
jgi:hypothetical protein